MALSQGQDVEYEADGEQMIGYLASAETDARSWRAMLDLFDAKLV